MKGVKVNDRRSHLNDLSCSLSKSPMEEYQEHGTTDILEEDECQDQQQEQGEGVDAVAGGHVNKEERVVEQLV